MQGAASGSVIMQSAVADTAAAASEAACTFSALAWCCQEVSEVCKLMVFVFQVTP